MEGQEVLKLSNGGGSPQVFESFFEGSTMPTLILDFDTLKVLNANQAAKKLFDMPFNQLVGTYFSEYAISPPHVFLTLSLVFHRISNRLNVSVMQILRRHFGCRKRKSSSFAGCLSAGNQIDLAAPV